MTGIVTVIVTVTVTVMGRETYKKEGLVSHVNIDLLLFIYFL